MRITVTDDRPAPLWSDEQRRFPTNVSYLVAPLSKVPRPFRVGLSPHRINSTSPIAAIKTSNYLDQTISLDDARSRGFNEAIRVNEHGHLACACMANVFWLKGAQLCTPSLSTGCLPGTTREFVLENCGANEVEAGVEELKQADAIFLTSAGLGVVQVDEFDGRELQSICHAIASLLPN